MTCKLGTLGIVFMALLTIDAVGASTASATGDQLTSSPQVADPVLTGVSHDNVFTITKAAGGTAAQFECTTAGFAATAEHRGEEVTALSTYTGIENETPHTDQRCSSSLGKVTVDMNGCGYVLTGDTSNEHSGGKDAKVWIECPAEKEIVITSGLCETTVPAQTPTEGGVTYTNETENELGVVKVSATITGITTTAKHSFGCTVAGVPSEGQTGDYTGTTSITGYEYKGGPENGDEFEIGNQLGIEVSEGPDGDQLTSSPQVADPVLTGVSHDNVFTITKAAGGTAAQFECTTAGFAATAEHRGEEVTALSTYTGIENETPHTDQRCSSSLGKVTVDMNGCGYVLTGDTSNEHSGGKDAKVWIECPAEKEIVITSGLCETTVPAQTPTEGGVTYTNETENELGVVKVSATITGITTTAKHSFGCTVAGVPSEGQTGDYTGTTSITGYEYKGGPENGDEFEIGNQLGIEVSEGPDGDQLTSSPQVADPVLTGVSHDNVFTITKAAGGTAAQFECTTAGFAATAEHRGEEVTALSTYTGIENETPHTSSKCSSTVGTVTVDMNGCGYVLTGDTSNEHSGGKDAKVWIECPAEKEIVITSGLCETTVPAQTPTEGGVTYTNETENELGVVKVSATITGITTTAKHSFGCTVAGIPSEGQTGDYTGTTSITGYEYKGGPENGDEFEIGNQLGIEVS